MTRTLPWILILAVTPLFAQGPYLVFAGCMPTGYPTCDVGYNGYSGAIGCNCSGTCTNGYNVRAVASVAWGCSNPQIAQANGEGYAEAYFVWASAEIIGPGNPFYEFFKEWDYCNFYHETIGGISGAC
jgi:hypothetical protein